jgi:OPA family sugar phosphate sensor protein UhpC-like MFS transporter
MHRLIAFFAASPPAPPLQDPQLIDRLYRRHRIGVLLTITIGYAFYYVCRLGLSVAREPLVSNGILTVEQTGMVGGALFIAYAIGKVTNGFMTDHGNVRRLFALGLLASALLNLVMGSVSAFWIFLAAWGLNGWFQAFGAPSCGVSVVNWFSNHERGRYYSIWNTSMPAGEAMTFALTAAIVSWLGWRAGFWTAGLVCMVVAIAAYLGMRDRPPSLGLPTIQDWKRDHGVAVRLDDDRPVTTAALHRRILTYPRLWILSAAAFFLYVTRYAISGWGIFYLQEARDLPLATAGAVLGVGTLAGIAGGLVYGFVSDTVFKARRPPVTAIYGAIDIVTLLLIFYYPTSSTAVLTVLFIVHGFVFSGLMIGILLFAIDVMPKAAVGAVGGIVGIGSYIAAAATEHVSGYLVGKGARLVDGVQTYDFSLAIMFWTGAMVLCILLASTLWKTEITD